MSIVVRPGTPEPNEVVSDETLHFNYPGSDIILRTGDSYDFRVPKLYIEICSPILRKLTRTATSTPDVPKGEGRESLPVVELPESKATIYSLLTFVFPVDPALPSTPEKIMELLAVAQKYQMDSVMAHIRGAIARQDPSFLRPETACHVYFLAQEHELRQEALQAARITLHLPMTIESLGDKLNFPGMTGAYLHELWKYHQRVRTDLKSDLLEFKNAGLSDDVKMLRCTGLSSYRPSSCFPQWLGVYINSIVEAPHLFDLIRLENARARHIKDETNYSCSCAGIPTGSQVIRAFWEALTAVVHGTIEKADSALSFIKEEPISEKSDDPPPVTMCLDLPDANVIVQSFERVNFRVHKSVLALSSPFFRDLLSLPQPPGDELVDGLPVIRLSEDAELLNILVSLLYPAPPVIPSSYEKVYALLVACQKYDMETVQFNIRARTKFGTFPAPVEAEAFRACAIAGSMGLEPELEDAARLTLRHRMTFESLGEQLRLFKGRSLCNLIRYRKRGNKAWCT